MQKTLIFPLWGLPIIFGLLSLISSCQKPDMLLGPNPISKNNTPEEIFFTAHRTTDPTEKALIDYLKRKNDELHFVDKTTKQIGYPRWDKITIVPDRTASQKGGSADAASTIYYIPFVRDSQNYVNASMAITTTPSDTSFTYLCDWQYAQNHNSTTSIADGSEHFAIFFMVLNKNVFGYNRFKITDSSLFRKGNKTPLYVDLDTIKSNAGKNSQRMMLVEFCQSVTIYFENCTWPGHPDCTPVCDRCWQFCMASLSYEYCWEEYVDGGDGGTGGGGTGGGTGGGGSTGGGSDGGSTGGGSSETGTPQQPCPTVPEAVRPEPGDGSTPCNGGGTGWEPVVPELEQPPLTDIVDMLPANFQGISTYITSSGVAITLPANAKVVVSKNIDVNIFPNGALYSFIMPNGDQYYAIQEEFQSPGSLVVPKPKFTQFYKTKIVNGKKVIDYNNPYPSSLFQYPAPVNGVVKAVRMRIEKSPNGNCTLVREIVDYSADSGVPSSASTSTDVNYAIEYLPALTSYTPESGTLSACPASGTSPAGQLKNMDQYVASKGANLASFLNDRLGSSVKIYLYDNVTNKAKYAITKNGIATVPVIDQASVITKFNNNTFTTTDQEIFIKASINNGIWSYEVKYNTSLVNVNQANAKIKPVFNEVVNEINKQTSEEVANLKTVGKTNTGETITVENDERFFKADMGLLESIAAIYDVGKHIIKQGQMPECIWDQGRRAGTTDAAVKAKYDKSVFKMPSKLSGCPDQLIDEVTGVIQFVKMGVEAIRRPRATFNGIYNGIKTLNKEKIKQILGSMSGYDNYTAGGDRASYQAGRHSVQAAMIFFNSIKLLTKGTDVVKNAGKEITEIQKFIPDGTVNSQVADVLKNAATNNKLVKNIDNEKLLTKNIVNGEEKIIAIDKAGDVYEGKALNNIDELSEDVQKSLDAGDLANVAEDAPMHNYAKTEPQKCIDGKKFEKNINADLLHTGKVQAASGINLSGFTQANGVQIRLPNGKYTVADNIWWKEVVVNGQRKFQIVVNESKLSSNAPFTQNQIDFKNYLSAGTNTFTLRNVKFTDAGFPQNAVLEVKAYVNTVSNGASGIGNYTVNKIY